MPDKHTVIHIGLRRPSLEWRAELAAGADLGHETHLVSDLDPAYTTVHRMWTADTQWSSEPSSPMRSLTGVCERLLLCERATDAALRSRAAGNGFIILP